MKIKINYMDKNSNLSDDEIRSYMNFDKLLEHAQKNTAKHAFRKSWLSFPVALLLVSAGLWFYSQSANDDRRSPGASTPATVDESKLSNDREGDNAMRENNGTDNSPEVLYDPKADARNNDNETGVSLKTPAVEDDPKPGGRSTGVSRDRSARDQPDAGKLGEGISASDPTGGEKSAGVIDATRDSYLQAQPRQGYDHLYSYFNENLAYPAHALKDSVEGISTVSFTIDENGQVSRITVTQSLGAEFDKEAVRLIREMPAWQPATFNGRPVASQLSVPLTFQLKRIKK